MISVNAHSDFSKLQQRFIEGFKVGRTNSIIIFIYIAVIITAIILIVNIITCPF